MSLTYQKTKTIRSTTYDIKPQESDEIKRMILGSILPSVSGRAILCGSGAICIYQNQTGIAPDSTYNYFDFFYANRETGEIMRTCNRDLDIVTIDPVLIKSIFGQYGSLTISKTASKYTPLFSERGIRSVERLTLHLFKDYVPERANPVIKLLAQLLIKLYGDIDVELSFDVVTLVNTGENIHHIFRTISKTWPISNLMRNFYFQIDDEGQLIPKMFSRPSYRKSVSSSSKIGLLDMLETLKMNIYMYDNTIAYSTNTGDRYAVHKKSKLFVPDYSKSHQLILNRALQTRFNPVINPNITRLILPSISYSSDLSAEQLSKTFHLSSSRATQALSFLKDGHECFCMEPFKPNIKIHVSKCGHSYHLNCFATYYLNKIIYKINLESGHHSETESSNNNHQCPYCRESYDELPPKPSSMEENMNYFGQRDQVYSAEEVCRHTPFVVL